MGARVAITGQPGVGKTTVCRAVVDRLGRSTGGMICSDITEGDRGERDRGGRRVGFELLDLQTGVKGVLAHIRGDGPRVGKYHVNLHDLDRIGVNAILSASGTDLIVINEIAPMRHGSDPSIQSTGPLSGTGLSVSDRNVMCGLRNSAGVAMASAKVYVSITTGNVPAKTYTLLKRWGLMKHDTTGSLNTNLK